MNSGRPLEREFSLEEKYARLEAKTRLLEAENELLKKLDLLERQMLKKTQLKQKKFELIHGAIKKYGLKRMVSYLCELIGASRSGYYNYFDKQSEQNRADQDAADEVV